MATLAQRLVGAAMAGAVARPPFVAGAVGRAPQPGAGAVLRPLPPLPGGSS